MGPEAAVGPAGVVAQPGVAEPVEPAVCGMPENRARRRVAPEAAEGPAVAAARAVDLVVRVVVGQEAEVPVLAGKVEAADLGAVAQDSVVEDLAVAAV